MKKILLGILCLSTLVLCSCEKQNPQNSNDIDIIDTDVISTQDPAEDTIVCTADVYECPDGSYVSRHGPNCEFDPCPTNNDPLFKGDTDKVREDLSVSPDPSLRSGGQEDSSLQEDTTDIDEIIQKYENDEEFDENGVDMLYEIIQSLEGN